MKKILLVFLLALTINVNAQQLSSKAQISLLTVSEGSGISDAFGHTAIRIKDDSLNIDTSFNYGVYDGFGTGFVLKFMRGQTDYLIDSDFTPNILRRYQEENRSVTEQILNLNLRQKQQLLDKLGWNLRPENRVYRYEFFFDNCATKARDVLEEVLGKNLVWDSKINPNLTFRQLLDTSLDTKPWWDLGIDMVLGSRIDKMATQRETMFLPHYLSQNLAKAKIKEQGKMSALVSKSQLIVPNAPQNPKNFNPAVITAWILCFLSLMFTYFQKHVPKWIVKEFDFFLMSILAVLGIVIFMLWFFTEHRSTPDNWNILWTLPFLFYLLGNKHKTMRILVIGGLCTVSLISFIHLFYPIQAFHPAVYPLIIALWLGVNRKVAVVE